MSRKSRVAEAAKIVADRIDAVRVKRVKVLSGGEYFKVELSDGEHKLFLELDTEDMKDGVAILECEIMDFFDADSVMSEWEAGNVILFSEFSPYGPIKKASKRLTEHAQGVHDSFVKMQGDGTIARAAGKPARKDAEKGFRKAVKLAVKAGVNDSKMRRILDEALVSFVLKS